MCALCLCFGANLLAAQAVFTPDFPPDKRGFSSQYNLYLVGHLLLISQGLTVSYFHNVAGSKRYRLLLSPQFSTFSVLQENRKFIFTGALYYKFVAKKRFETAAFVGLNYVLSRLDYARYEYEGIVLTNKDRFLDHFGPSVGASLGYKIIKRPRFSIAPFLGVAHTLFNKSYEPNLFEGYKPSFNLGFILNRYNQKDMKKTVFASFATLTMLSACQKRDEPVPSDTFKNPLHLAMDSAVYKAFLTLRGSPLAF
jgi:hypothetical protein